MSIEVSVLLPTYNEAGNIIHLIQKIINEFENLNIDFEIIVIDDNSPDKTANIVTYTFQSDNRIILLSRDQKLGLGSAYIHGLQYANGNYILIMDADFSHEPESIPIFWETIKKEKSDIVIGSRYISNGKIENWNWKRRLVSFIANSLTRLILTVPISDLTGSFRLYNKNAIRTCAPLVQGKGYVFQMEILVHAHTLGYKINQVPIHFRERRAGTSKFCFAEVWQFFKALYYLQKIC